MVLSVYYRRFHSCYLCITGDSIPAICVLQEIPFLLFVYYRRFHSCYLCITGDSIPPHLEWEPEHPALLVQPGAGGPVADEGQL